jgi:hypothetical protein
MGFNIATATFKVNVKPEYGRYTSRNKYVLAALSYKPFYS